MRTLLIRSVGAVALLAGMWAAHSQAPAPARPFASQKIHEDLYMITGGGGNVAAYITNEGVILVDDMYERDFDGVMGEVKKLTTQPVRYVLNTHQHDDHAGSNAKMMAFAEVISHKNARANMVRLKQSGQARLSYADEFEVALGGKTVRAYHYGRGHTNGDAIIHFVDAKVIHTGDLLLSAATRPYMDYENGGSAIEWSDALDKAAKLDFDTIIPGHGPLTDRAGLAKWQAEFQKMRVRISGLARSGASKDAISQVLIDEFGWPKGGLALAQVEPFIVEMKSWKP